MIIHFKGKHLLICLSSILSQVFCAFLRKRMQTSQKVSHRRPSNATLLLHLVISLAQNGRAVRRIVNNDLVAHHHRIDI